MKTLYKYFFNQSVINPEFLIFFRITTGIIVLVHFLSIKADFQYLYGSNKILPTDIQTYSLSENIIYYDNIIMFLKNNFNLTLSFSESLFYFLFIILCFFIVIGFYSRISAFFLIFLQVALIKSSYFFTYGVDYFTTMSLFYVILFPSDDYFSIRKRIFLKLNNNSNLTPFKKLMQIHICWAYGMSGIEKLSGYNWRNGESVWKALHLPSFENPFIEQIDYLGKFSWIFVISGWAIIIIELLYPLFVNIYRTRKLWLYLTILMHVFIALFLNLYFFSAIMIVWNITNYYFDDKHKISD